MTLKDILLMTVTTKAAFEFKSFSFNRSFTQALAITNYEKWKHDTTTLLCILFDYVCYSTKKSTFSLIPCLKICI